IALAGLSEVQVARRPRTLYIPTGDEIVPLEEWLRAEVRQPGQVGETNSLLVTGYFSQWGFPVDVAPCLPDDPDRMASFLQEHRDRYDLILLCAGSAKGERDHTFSLFERMGEPLFRWLLMKPGRPASAALLGRTVAVNLPGFPMSNAVILWSIVYPILQLLSRGGFDEKTVFPQAIGALGTEELMLMSPYSSSHGREEWVRLKCAELEGVRKAYPLPSGASSLWSFSEMDAVALLPSAAAELPRGSSIEAWMVRDVPWGNRILFQGSNDPALERIATSVRRQGGDIVLRSIGSLGGLAALARGDCHLTACHLLHPGTGTYNTPYLEEFFGGDGDIVRRLIFFRQQGMILRRGNPKSIRSVGDLRRPDVSLVNRQTGAGTRVLLDVLLMEEGVEPGEVQGYDNQSVTHFDAANKVALGFADVALGIKSVADALHLDFLPLCEEPYELVYRASHDGHPGMRALLSALEDKAWRSDVEAMGGYRWPA
ncbi:MAG TPA: molybdopterin biosynthesis protein MoeA, partial [Synergistaceae bacterium]|nr:molybdopterin biosynthesis protein MoeA [Synergistaceae bacterium]